MSASYDALTVVGFGGRAPSEVLELLSTALKTSIIGHIVPDRSQSIQFALLEPPYRTFLNSTPSTQLDFPISQKRPSFILYCKPSSLSEYIAAANEAADIRTALLTGSAPVAIFNPTNSTFLGGSMEHVLEALRGDSHKAAQLNSAALSALAALDQNAANHFAPKTKNQRTVVLVGSGGREHAIAVALAKSPLVSRIICCPGNGGTAIEGGKITNAQGVNGKQDNDTVIDIVNNVSADMVVVGPEAPLVAGLVDQLSQRCPQVKVFGPSKAAAQLEASKAFTKDFLQQHGIPSAKYRTFTDAQEAIDYVRSLADDDRQVVKASGLAAGKGVLIPQTKDETISAVMEIMENKAYGAAGDTCVIESFLVGPEASCLALCDGHTAVLMPAAQDHKRALDGDQGLNTGGMGAYAPAPCVTRRLQKEIQEMCVKTVQKMAERGTPYVGVLYAGMMLTPQGPMVLEFNCRFGDPEAQVVLPLLETDLYEVFEACCNGKLDQIDIRFKENTSATTVVCAAKGYPISYPKGMKIQGLSDADTLDNVKIYHAGTKLDGNDCKCSGGRVLAVTGLGNTLKEALRLSYCAVHKLDFVGDQDESFMHYRTDIAKRATNKKLRIGVIGSTRGTALIPVMEACKTGGLNAEIVSVISNKQTAPILDKGRSLGVTVSTKHIPTKGLTRDEYDAECSAVLLASGVELILLVGYMRILSKPFTDLWKGQCINVHPSLLPKHAGGMDLAVHQAVIDAGDQETGCTIHVVNEDVDGGPILVQKKVAVAKNDTPETLKSKVQALEGAAFIEAIAALSKGEAVRYADAGVDIDAGNELIDSIKPACKATQRPGCEADLGGFGGLFDLAAAGYDAAETVLVGGTDGVGTKLKIAHTVGKHKSVGIDLVAMCVNDILVAGGEPLFFLDYYATGRLNVSEAAAVVKGIAEGCKQARCGLIGGETAEMSGMYRPGEYDLAGFCVGAVKRANILPQRVEVGDVLIGLKSSGIHSNGFSLVRRLVQKEGLSYDSPCPWDSSSSLADVLLTPTRIYVKSCLPLIKDKLVKAMAHITGGGLLENLPRSLPKGLGAKVNGHPPLTTVFQWLRNSSGLDDSEMLRTFNCGVGLVIIVGKEHVRAAIDMLETGGEEVYVLGSVVEGNGVVVENAI